MSIKFSQMHMQYISTYFFDGFCVANVEPLTHFQYLVPLVMNTYSMTGGKMMPAHGHHMKAFSWLSD